MLASLGQHADKEACMACLREYAALAQPAEGGDGQALNPTLRHTYDSQYGTNKTVIRHT